MIHLYSLFNLTHFSFFELYVISKKKIKNDMDKKKSAKIVGLNKINQFEGTT